MKQLLVLITFFIVTPFALANASTYSESFKVESIGALTEPKVAEAVRGALEEKGLRIADAKGKTVCEVWFRKEIPVGNAEVPGASFGQIPEGTFIGVINFPSNVSDFRGQGIKAGWYTLRFVLILQDGNHLGVSPSRDFFLLLPAADDKDPNTQMKVEDMLKLSRVATGAGHPSPWSLMAASSDKDLPRVITNEHEHVILEVKLNTRSGPLAVGFIIIGRTEG
jgi:hypothetical protein